jgi:RNA polymerase-interacting CarD/CdnL/TRCF family regulator
MQPKTLYTIVPYREDMVNTTIQISKELLEELKVRKMHSKESYEEVIWDLIEDTRELSEQTKKNIKKSEEELKSGKFYSIEEVEARLKKCRTK